MLGYQSRQERLLPLILKEKQKQEYRINLGERGRKVNTFEFLLRAEKKGLKKGIGKIVHDLRMEKEM